MRIFLLFLFIICRSSNADMFPSWTHLGGPGGESGDIKGSVLLPPASTLAAIASVQAAWAATPPLSGTVHYFCDCGTGATASCVAGNDSNNGSSKTAPKRTMAAVQALFRSPIRSGDTVALCQGGSFLVNSQLDVGSTTCKPGTTCNDLREYSPTTFASSAKPILLANSSLSQLFNFANANEGGVRILNLDLEGTSDVNYAFLLMGIKGSSEGHIHDVTIGNDTINGFSIAVYSESGYGHNVNIDFSGNTVTDNSVIGYLGSADNSIINYNYWTGNGGDTAFHHTLYITGGAQHGEINNMAVVGNYIHGQPASGSCVGAILNSHGALDHFSVQNNYITTDATVVAGGCYGIALSNLTTNANPVNFRHTVVSGNTVVNGGTLGIWVTSCPGCIIENNTVIMDWHTTAATVGIAGPDNAARSQDDVGNNYTIKNNTVYFSPRVSSTYGSIGIRVHIEGTGHIVSNNTVYYASGSGAIFCFQEDLPLTSYTFINNNHCHSAPSQFNWMTGPHGGTLAAWQSYAGSYGFDSASITGDPKFVSVGTDFTPAAGSPLIRAGNNTYKSTLDITGKTRPNPPAIGAYEP